jgi:hypothetical protein
MCEEKESRGAKGQFDSEFQDMHLIFIVEIDSMGIFIECFNNICQEGRVDVW